MSYHSSTSAGTVRPESRLGSTQPEPIMACGCTGKLPVKVHPSISSWLGEAFRKMSWRFSMHPDHPLISPGCPSTVLHLVVNLKSIFSLKSWGCHHLDSHISLMNLSTNPVYEHSKINYIVPGNGNKGKLGSTYHMILLKIYSISPTACMVGRNNSNATKS